MIRYNFLSYSNLNHKCFCFLFQTSGPSGSTLNPLAIYLLVSLSFVSATLFQFAFVLLLNRNMRNEESKLKRKLNGLEVNELNNYRKRPVKLYSIIPSCNNASWITKIDVTAFCLYTCGYFVFNFQYWMSYYFIQKYDNKFII